jgi:hypothetical protein
MIRALIRLMAGAFLTAIFFSAASVALGYLSIDVLKWHAPYPAPTELAVLETGLVFTAPVIIGLSLLGMLLAWGDARRLSMRPIVILALSCSLILAILFTLEDIPRNQAPWLESLLPVAVVTICYWATRILGKRERADCTMSAVAVAGKR